MILILYVTISLFQVLADGKYALATLQTVLGGGGSFSAGTSPLLSIVPLSSGMIADIQVDQEKECTHVYTQMF